MRLNMRPSAAEREKALVARIAEGYLRAERSYATDWKVEAESWQDLGIYGKVAETLPLDDGYRHVDFGHGLGHVGRAIKQRSANGTVLGLEINSASASDCQSMNLAAGIATVVYDGSSYKSVPGGKISKVCEIGRDEIAEIAARVGQNLVIVVVDDVRSTTLVKDLCASRQISSGTFVLSGSDDPLAETEIPIRTKCTEPYLESVRSRVKFATRMKADEAMAAMLLRDGVYTLAERVAYDPECEDDVAVRTYIQDRLGALMAYFDLGSSSVESPETVARIQRGNIGWTYNQVLRAKPTEAETARIKPHLIIAQLRRNGKKFGTASSNKKRR